LALNTLHRTASYICIIIIFTIVLLSGSIVISIPGIPTQKIVTDKESYNVGDTIHARWIFVNLNNWPITFTLPLESSCLTGEYSWENKNENCMVFLSPAYPKHTLLPGEEFTILSSEYHAHSEGSFIIRCALSSKIVKINK